jgi:hypothetical protein
MDFTMDTGDAGEDVFFTTYLNDTFDTAFAYFIGISG